MTDCGLKCTFACIEPYVLGVVSAQFWQTLLSDLLLPPTLCNKIGSYQAWYARCDLWAQQGAQHVHSKLCGNVNGGAVCLFNRQNFSGGEVTQHLEGCMRPCLGGAAGLQQYGNPICSK